MQDKLLIVDDIPANISLLLDFLTDVGFKVLVAKDGEAAIKKAEYARPNLILLDVMMPGINGFEVCKRLKTMPTTQDIPIIFMTALSDTVDKVKGFSLGAVDYITKPLQAEEVLARVSAHLNLRKLQQQLEAEIKVRKVYATELEERNLELKSFAHTVAHDLRGPLTGIMSLSDRLLSKPTSDRVQLNKYLQLISDSGQKMLEIISALLLLAGVSQQDSIRTQAIDMEDIINQVLEKRTNHLFKELQAEIILPDDWPIAKSYGPWVEEVWANYISNGLKYGGRPPKLELGATVQDNNMIKFWIHDNGAGLSKSAQTKLFTPFTRLHDDNVEGYGLGLAIVRQVVEKLGGEVGIESIENKGSMFYFTLPAIE
ncbi:hybrid sensor histidine kinase/response regulator [Candidatus Halobeggiatoa sp. HSG11]|nr:hybrid sensor histidine kinase/response regulator [Candidatus Halobeggiatoa sp. HSG11]